MSSLYLGVVQEGNSLRYIRHQGPEHVIVIAPTGTGKGTTIVYRNLLSWDGPAVIYDPKGENWQGKYGGTAGWRSKEAGQTCVRFEPLCTDGTAVRYNPLEDVRPWPDDVGDVQLIAEALVPFDHKQSDHWNRTARAYVSGVILHQLYAGQDKTLTGCHRRMTDPYHSLLDNLAMMRGAIHDPTASYGWEDEQGPTLTHPYVASGMRSVENMSERERSSVISSATSHFEIYRDPWVALNMSASDFSIDDVAENPAFSLYIVIPPSDLDRLAPLSRLLFLRLTQRLTRSGEAQRDRRVLFVIDELPTLDDLKLFRSELAFLRGYGIQFLLVIQDLGQLDEIYGRENSILGNCHVRIFFTPLKLETAQTISHMLGERTVRVPRRNYTGSRWAMMLTHVIASDEDVKRPLLSPSEVLTMSDREMIIFVGSLPPVRARKVHYYEDAEFLRRSLIPAPQQSGKGQVRVSYWQNNPAPWKLFTDTTTTPEEIDLL